MMDFDDIKDKANQIVVDMVDSGDLEIGVRGEVSDELDQRGVPSTFWYNPDVLIVKKGSVKMMDYYLGFEYINSEDRMDMGDYVVFDFYGESEQLDDFYNAINK